MATQTDFFLVVMAGGSGTRFWPRSTSRKPKQLLNFRTPQEAAGRSLLQQTLERFARLVPRSQRMILTTQALASAVADQAEGVELLAEPQGRNTAPCIYWAARAIAERNPRAVMLVMPSDHYISDVDQFETTVMSAGKWARDHRDLVTLGITPTRPETGYGYVKVSAPTSDSPHLESSPLTVEAFVEKPGLEKAQAYLRSRDYLWNGGMFAWRVDVILEAFDRWMPEMKRAWDEHAGQVEKAYPQMTATSIDYGILEKAQNVVSFPLNAGWDDLGSWTSLESVAQAWHLTQGGNTVVNGKVSAIDSEGNIVDAPGRFVALLGVQDLVVVEQGEAVLIADKKRAQDLRLVVEQVKKLRPDLA